MLTDGLVLAEGSEVSRQVLTTARGIAFPGSPADGDVFELTAPYQGNGIGIYAYFSSEAAWVVKYPNNDIMPYDVSVSTIGTMNAGDTIARHITPRTYRLKEGLNGCVASALVASVVDTSLTLFKVDRSGNQEQIGTLFFGVTENVGVFSQTGSGDVIFTAGEHLVVKAPAVADVSLADIAISLAGTLV